MMDPSNPRSCIVLTTMDKFQDRYVLICKNAYRKIIFDSLLSPSYEKVVDESEGEIIARILKWTLENDLIYATSEADEDGNHEEYPTALSQPYASIKMHKIGARMILGGVKVPLTPLSHILSRALRTFRTVFDMIFHNLFMKHTGIVMNTCPLLRDGPEMVAHLERMNVFIAQGIICTVHGDGIGAVASADFTQLYPMVVQSDVLRCVRAMIELAFKYALAARNLKLRNGRKLKRLLLLVAKYPIKTPGKFVTEEEAEECGPEELILSSEDLIVMLEYLVKNGFCVFGAKGEVFKIVRGIMTGTNAAPEITNYYLLFYEFEFYLRMLPEWHSLSPSTQAFLLSYRRFIDDIWSLRTNGSTQEALNEWMFHDKEKDGMFPKFLMDPTAGRIDNPLELNTVGGCSCDFLDLTTELLVDGFLNWKGFDKREGMFVMGVPMSTFRNFPHINTHLTNKYSLVTSELCRFSKVFKERFEFAKRVVRFANKLIKGGYNKRRIIQKIKNFGVKWTKGKWPVVLKYILKHFRGRAVVQT